MVWRLFKKRSKPIIQQQLPAANNDIQSGKLEPLSILEVSIYPLLLHLFGNCTHINEYLFIYSLSSIKTNRWLANDPFAEFDLANKAGSDYSNNKNIADLTPADRPDGLDDQAIAAILESRSAKIEKEMELKKKNIIREEMLKSMENLEREDEGLNKKFEDILRQVYLVISGLIIVFGVVIVYIYLFLSRSSIMPNI